MKKIIYITLFLTFIIFTVSKAQSYDAFNGGYNYNQYNNQNSAGNFNAPGISDETLFIVDFSSSMNQKLGYTPKIYLAVDAIRNVLSKYGKEMKVGLRIFGVTDKPITRQTSRGIEYIKENICTASKLVLPIARYNNDNISDRLSYINPKGATPIGYSLREAVQNDFSLGGHKKHIILITDGAENCGDDPCEFIRYIMQTRNDITIDVIGITVSDNDYSKLKCISSNGRGQYFSVNSSEDFKTKFEQALRTTPPQTSNTLNITNKTIPVFDKTKYKTYGFQFEY